MKKTFYEFCDDARDAGDSVPEYGSFKFFIHGSNRKLKPFLCDSDWDMWIQRNVPDPCYRNAICWFCQGKILMVGQDVKDWPHPECVMKHTWQAQQKLIQKQKAKKKCKKCGKCKSCGK